MYRRIYDLQFTNHADAFPGVLMRSEGESALERQGDPAVNQLYDNMGIVYEFFKNVFNDNKMFRKKQPPVGIVHFGFYFGSAWLHSGRDESDPQALVFGDGWDHDPFNDNAPRLYEAGQFGNFVASLEVVAHEMCHGFIDAVSYLGGFGESGALHEHLADVFGIMCQQWHNRHGVDDANWLVGEDLVLPSQKGLAMRSIKDPGTAYNLEEFGAGFDKQVKKKDNMYHGREDYGGVHTNSGVPNRAFYLVAKGLSAKHSWEQAGQIWYAALIDRKMDRECDFARWACLTHEKGTKISSDVALIVSAAWGEVGIEVGTTVSVK
jgi:Zn-dependent metalloprotease